MAKKYRELTTLAPPPARCVSAGQPRVVRVRLHTRGDEQWYEMNNWLRVPAWTRHLDGLRLRTLALALLAVGAAGWAAWRLVGGTK